jgi:hypothetical protein
MMLLLEERESSRRLVNLFGAVHISERFYTRFGYTGALQIQTEKHGIDELLSLNTGYEVIYIYIYSGNIN